MLLLPFRSRRATQHLSSSISFIALHFRARSSAARVPTFVPQGQEEKKLLFVFFRTNFSPFHFFFFFFPRRSSFSSSFNDWHRCTNPRRLYNVFFFKRGIIVGSDCGRRRCCYTRCHIARLLFRLGMKRREGKGE